MEIRSKLKAIGAFLISTQARRGIFSHGMAVWIVQVGTGDVRDDKRENTDTATTHPATATTHATTATTHPATATTHITHEEIRLWLSLVDAIWSVEHLKDCRDKPEVIVYWSHLFKDTKAVECLRAYLRQVQAAAPGPERWFSRGHEVLMPKALFESNRGLHLIECLARRIYRATPAAEGHFIRYVKKIKNSLPSEDAGEVTILSVPRVLAEIRECLNGLYPVS